MKLIGYPFASGINRLVSDYDVVEVVGKCPLPSSVLTRHTMNTVSDITGAGTGNGDGKTRLRPARSTGQGIDPDVERAQCEEELASRSGWVGEMLHAEHALGEQIMVYAGGREFLAGKAVRIDGNGMAPRAARYIRDRRGRTPSDTSLDDAAASAALEIVKQVRVWEYVLNIDGDLPDTLLRQDAVIRSHVCGCAWRAAFHSLDGDCSDGSTGRQAGDNFDGTSLALDAGQLAAQRESLQAWTRGERIIEYTAPELAGRAVCSWIWRNLVPTYAPGANKARARDCARRQARFLIRLVHGASWADAARLAGFADGKAASQSLAREHTFRTLSRAQANESSQHPIGRALFRNWMRAARAEVKARRTARVWIKTTPTRGQRRKAKRGLPTGTDATAAILVNHFAPDTAPRVSRKLRAMTVDVAATASRAIDARELAARATCGAKARLVAFRARATADWEKASKGLRRGFLA